MTGDEIRAERERRNLSQEELAYKLGVTTKTLGTWERGTSSPRGYNHDTIQRFFGIPPVPTLEQKIDAILTALGIDPATV